MPRMPLDRMNCSIARTLGVIGDGWTPLILRDIGFGVTRFDALQRDLGISRKVLSERLASLVEHGALRRVPYQDKPVRYDYFPTEKGADLAFVLLAMKSWGDRWTLGDAGVPIEIRHESCGEMVEVVPSCSHCGERITLADVTPLPGPGFEPGPGTTEISAALERRAAAASSKA